MFHDYGVSYCTCLLKNNEAMNATITVEVVCLQIILSEEKTDRINMLLYFGDLSAWRFHTVVIFILVIFVCGDMCLWSFIYVEFIVGGDCCVWRLLFVVLLYAVEIVVFGAYALKAFKS